MATTRSCSIAKTVSFRFRAYALSCALALCASGLPAASAPPDPGSVFIASAEGVSVFDRDGAMSFGHFVTSLKDGKPGPVEWDDMIYDGWRLPSGNYLCSSHRYVRELDPQGNTLWEFRLEAPSELKTCVPLPNGDVMTVDATRMELVQISAGGKGEVKRIPVPTTPTAPEHERYNLLRRTPAGTFLLALRSEKAFIEIDETGKELWRHPVPELPVVAERLANGNTLMSWKSGLIEAAPDHTVVWELKVADITDFPVIITGGFYRFENGNTLIANSDWHYKADGENRVQLFEVTPDKKVVWTLGTDAFAGKKPGSLEPSTGLVEQRIIGIQWLPEEKQTAATEDFFQAKVQPILAANCVECHSHAQKIKGGLALDSRSGIIKGGEGGAVLVPGKPEESRLITAVRHVDKDFQMPPKSKLSEADIAVLTEWIAQGALDPRAEEGMPQVAEKKEWDEIYKERLGWWSLQPLADPPVPTVNNAAWPRNDVDRFLLASLESKGLAPAPGADRRTLARRLSFALTGLPPKHEEVERFAAEDSPEAYEALVQSLMDSPHFGERWARHWMDVVHYADTHGYEWDTPAKNAWMYRDYLVRAFNGDVPFNQLILEQIAGDLVEPRIDPATGLNEALIGTTAMRLGERRHGDNADAEGVTQEAVANIIDTVSKGFIGTTVACAQCHDHKLDAVAQKDYYSLAGVLMSSRWISRPADASDPNGPVIEELRGIKSELRAALASHWLAAGEEVTKRIAETPIEDSPPPADAKKPAKAKPAEAPKFPESAKSIWRYLNKAAQADGATFESAWSTLAGEFQPIHAVRQSENRKNLQVLADLTREELPPGWRIDGLGMKYGLVEQDGELAVGSDEGTIVTQLLPAGRWSNVWSERLAGGLRSPLFTQNPAPTISVEYGAGHFAAGTIIVDNAFHSERVKFLKQSPAGWLTLPTGNFVALAGGNDPTPRRAYLELVTKSLNNYFPPRYSLGGVAEVDEVDPRSWFGVSRIYEHPEGKGPGDELARYAPLFEGAAPQTSAELAAHMGGVIIAAVERWSAGGCTTEDVRLLNEALALNWLPNDPAANPDLAAIAARYRETEKRLQPDRVVGSVDDWYEGRDERIGVRGSYTVFGDVIPRGTISFLGGPGARAFGASSGRLELARNIASDANPLSARVYVNRVWHHLFGAGIVRTPDDFGHLGELPSHPELLDWLARRFMAEGWSTKKLIHMLVTSSAWRQRSVPNPAAVVVDPENRLLHHMPLRRLEAESIRDAMLAASGRLDSALYGPPINPFRVAEDKNKRLHTGPLDGDGRRSLYLKMTMMEPPRFLGTFNQPLAKVTVGRRDATNVPNQALALLNDPFVVAMAEHWSKGVLDAGDATPDSRVERMFSAAFARPPQPEETARFVAFAQESAKLRGVDVAIFMNCQPVWQDVAHAIFNLKEFIYVQ
jgi:mono/diheme cytochrome c family protein